MLPTSFSFAHKISDKTKKSFERPDCAGAVFKIHLTVKKYTIICQLSIIYNVYVIYKHGLVKFVKGIYF